MKFITDRSFANSAAATSISCIEPANANTLKSIRTAVSMMRQSMDASLTEVKGTEAERKTEPGHTITTSWLILREGCTCAVVVASGAALFA